MQYLLNVTDCVVLAVAPWPLEFSGASTLISALVTALQAMAHLISFLFLLWFTFRGPVMNSVFQKR